MSRYNAKKKFINMRYEYECTNKKAVVLMPILLVFLAIFTRWVSGSPLSTLHFVGAKNIIPPIWLMVLLFCVFYTVAGVGFGMAIGKRAAYCEAKKYQGSMWFVIAMSTGYIWYPIFFCARLFLVSAVLCGICLFASICATFCFARVSKISFFLMLIFDSWLIYLTLLNMQIFFAI